MAIGVINDPELIKQYRNDISNRIEELQQNLSKTNGAIQTVSQGWKDSQFQQFHDHFDQDKEMIGKLMGVLEKYRDDILGPLQARMENYLCESMIRLK